MKPKLVITGASGFLGYHLLQTTAKDWEVYPLRWTHALKTATNREAICNLTDYIALGNLLEKIEPDAVLHLAAISDTNYCEQHREESYAVNVEATRNLAGLCSDFQIPFVFTSTDLVFDGKKGMYCETDAPNPLNRYGEQKAKAEEEAAKIYPPSLIVRLPLLFGDPKAGDGNYLSKLLKQLAGKQRARLFTDEYRSVCGARSISIGLLQMIGQSGILHLAGTERLSRFDFGTKAAQAFELDPSLLQPILQKDLKMAAPRPADVSLSVAKAVGLGFAPMLVGDELCCIAHNNYFR